MKKRRGKMEENKMSKGKEILAILLLTMVIGTGTLAWIVWSSKDNTKMNVTIGDLADVSFKTGNDINISNLSPSFYYDDGALTEFSIRKKKGLTTTLNTNIYLDITSISDELKNDSFKYVLLSSSDGNTYNEVISSSFKDASVGKLDIVTDSPLTDGKTYYKFYIWIDGNNENNETMQGKSLKGTLNVDVSTPPVNAVTLVNSLDDGTTGDSGSGVYKVTHSAIPAESSVTGSEIPAVTDYRYYGDSPNNYVCLDTEGSSGCPSKHRYRIIGSIYEESSGQNLIKVIKNYILEDNKTRQFSWDYKSDGTYSNVWSTTTSGTDSGSTIMQLLNGIWLTRESGSYYNNSTTATIVDFANYDGLSDTAQSFINATSRYYLGITSDTYTSYIYINERTGATSSGSAKYWDGKIGLMYPSDYGYAAGSTCVRDTRPNLYSYDSNHSSKCHAKDWIHSTSTSSEWTITSSASGAWSVSYEGSLVEAKVNGRYYHVRPVFYLKPDTNIIDGDGSWSSPYILSLD